jgi:hypothetical protein
MCQWRIALCIKYNEKIEFSTGKMGYFFFNFMRYEIFLLATYQTVLLHCMIYQNTCWGGVLTFLDTCYDIMPFLFCLPSLFCWSKVHNPFLPCHHVPELGAVCHSDGLLHLLNLVFPTFRSFCFEHLLPILQSLSYRTSCETNLEVLLTANSYCTGFFTYISVIFSSYFFRKVALKNSI